MVDWALAERIATWVAGPAPAPAAPGDLARLRAHVAEGERLVLEYTRLARAAVPEPEGVDRAGWISANLNGLRVLLDPVADRASARLGPLQGPLRGLTGALLGAEVGVIAGYLAQRVLGQYEFGLLDPDAPARLLFVAPNLEALRRRLDADGEELLSWVALHEVTHAVQFGAVPWLRSHLAARASALLHALEVRLEPGRLARLPDPADVRALVQAVRDGDLVALAVGPSGRRQLDELQALMAVLEGYAEHVMDAAGREVLPSLPRLRARLEARRRDKSGLLRLFEKLLGLDRKLQQYERGKAFCDEVVSLAGVDALNRVWTRPEALPTLRELERPAAWLARTAGESPPGLPAAGPA